MKWNLMTAYATEWRHEMIAACSLIAPQLPVPELPPNFTTAGWFVRPDIVAKRLTRDDRLFELRLDYNDGMRTAHKTIEAFGDRVQPTRVKGKIVDLVTEAVYELRRQLMIIT